MECINDSKFLIDSIHPSSQTTIVILSILINKKIFSNDSNLIFSQIIKLDPISNLLKLVQTKFTVCISRNISKFGPIVERDKKEKRVETVRDFIFHPQ